MQFNMKCETYVRLNKVLRHFKPLDAARECFRSIYVERKNGNLVAVVTNGMLLAAELIEQQSGDDDHMHLTIDPLLLAQCEIEAGLAGSLHIVNIPQLGHAAAKTTFGYQYPGNAALTFNEDVVHAKWRNVVDNSHGAPSQLIIVAEAVADLGFASPSGILVFPETIDGAKPVVVRDSVDPNWFGMFMPYVNENGVRVKRKPATYPEWAL